VPRFGPTPRTKTAIDESRERKRKIIVMAHDSHPEWPWEKIARLVGYHPKTCQRIYREECNKSGGAKLIERRRKEHFKRTDRLFAFLEPYVYRPAETDGRVPPERMVNLLVKALALEAKNLGLPLAKPKASISPGNPSSAASDDDLPRSGRSIGPDQAPRRTPGEIRDLQARVNAIYGV
jgi:hypothetical protein